MDTSEGQILDMLDKGCKRWICQEGAKRKTIKIPGCSQGGHGTGGCNSRGSKTWQQKNHVANTSLMLFFIVFLLSSVFRVLRVVISQSINNRKPSFPPEGVVLSSPDFTSALIRLLYIIYEPFLCRELLGSQSA